MSILYELKNIEYFFDEKRVLSIDNLILEENKIIGFFGPNGSGKSTLFSILSFISKPQNGEIIIDENIKKSVVMLPQNPYLLKRTVFENIAYGLKIRGESVDLKSKVEEALSLVGLDKNFSNRKWNQLSGGEAQRVALASRLILKPKVLILDEPTSSLTENEVNHLFKIVRKLKDQGIGVVYISHKMEEITALCDEITILRDGKWIATEKVEGMSTDHVINLMVGRDLTSRFPEKSNIPKEVIMEVKNLTAKVQPSIIDVTFDLHKGEILGIAGLVGAKRTEIVETIFGMRSIESGEIYIHGKKTNIRSPKEATQNGLALITEERRTTGIFGMLDIKFNSIISNIKSYKGTAGLLDDSKITKDTKWVIDSMRVKTPTQKTQIGSLSGGNQQKVIIGRWLLTEPEILLMDEPTRGIDVGAKFEIYQLMINLANKDKGVVMISSEMPELLGVTDRILVMSNGRVAGIVNTKETSQEEILKLTAKYL